MVMSAEKSSSNSNSQYVNPIHQLIADWELPKLDISTPPDLLLLGDIHARDDQPACRVDAYVETQVATYKWLRDLWSRLECPRILQPGDLFHKWQCSPYTINMVLRNLPAMITIPGNPGKHNYYVAGETDHDPVGVIDTSNVGWVVLCTDSEMGTYIPLSGVVHLTAVRWGADIPVDVDKSKFNILLTHRSIVESGSAFDGEESNTFFDAYHMYDLIVTGHNHKPIVLCKGSQRRTLLNLGILIGQTADETHTPHVAAFWVKERHYQLIPVPHDPAAISRSHIDTTNTTNERKVAFVESLNTHTLEITASFKTNMELVLSTDTIRESVKIRLQEAMDYDNPR